MMIDFGASWCAACKELEHLTFPDPSVRTEAQKFVSLKVDATDDDDKSVTALKDKYKVVGLPTVIIIDKDGKEVTRFNEFVKADRFSAAMKKANGTAVSMNR
jgi:thiol:disulfide interchange protein DsbD